ncbi:MAG: hypothetical protein P1V97_13330 [Planctomycetota bacterium]|nr:hypothetical protein [Planctomycetota bacterium]
MRLKLRHRLPLFAVALFMLGCSSSEGDPPVTQTLFQFSVSSPGDTSLAEFDGTIINFAGPNGSIVNGQESFVAALHGGATASLTPSNIFAQQSPSLQVVIGAQGENVLVSGDSFATLAGGGANPSAGGDFGAFSGATNFSVIGNTITVTFTTMNGTTPGLVNAFGVVFTDVEVADKSGLRFLDADGGEILNLRCPPGASGASQFIGAVFAQPQIASVQIDMGDNANSGSGPEDPMNGGDDYIVIDDFHYDLSQTPIPLSTPK